MQSNRCETREGRGKQTDLATNSYIMLHNCYHDWIVRKTIQGGKEANGHWADGIGHTALPGSQGLPSGMAAKGWSPPNQYNGLHVTFSSGSTRYNMHRQSQDLDIVSYLQICALTQMFSFLNIPNTWIFGSILRGLEKWFPHSSLKWITLYYV